MVASTKPEPIEQYALRRSCTARMPLPPPPAEGLMSTGKPMRCASFSRTAASKMDAERNFLPATGRVAHLRFPDESDHIRIDTGVVPGIPR